MGTKQNPGEFDCYSKAEPDEPLFILRAKDPLAAGLVEQWAQKAEDNNLQEPRKITEARACAEQMRAWRAGRKLN